MVYERLLLLQWSAFSIGALGTLAWAMNNRYSKWAAVFWLVSGSMWIYFSMSTGQDALIWRDLLGLSICAFGIYRWLSPNKDKAQKLMELLQEEAATLSPECIDEITHAIERHRLGAPKQESSVQQMLAKAERHLSAWASTAQSSVTRLRRYMQPLQ